MTWFAQSSYWWNRTHEGTLQKAAEKCPCQRYGVPEFHLQLQSILFFSSRKGAREIACIKWDWSQMKGNLTGNANFHGKNRGFPVMCFLPKPSRWRVHLSKPWLQTWRMVGEWTTKHGAYKMTWRGCIWAEMMIKDGNQHKWLAGSINGWVPDNQLHNETYYWESMT